MSHARTAIETSIATGNTVDIDWCAPAHFELERCCDDMSVGERYRFVGSRDGRDWTVTMGKPKRAQ